MNKKLRDSPSRSIPTHIIVIYILIPLAVRGSLVFTLLNVSFKKLSHKSCHNHRPIGKNTRQKMSPAFSLSVDASVIFAFVFCRRVVFSFVGVFSGKIASVPLF
jgi:hypothetical protein